MTKKRKHSTFFNSGFFYRATIVLLLFLVNTSLFLTVKAIKSNKAETVKTVKSSNLEHDATEVVLN